MKNQIEQTLQRTQRYWYTDGLSEMAAGLVILLIGLMYLSIMMVPPGPASLALGFSQPIIIILIAWLSNKAVRGLKERITFSRTGYVTYPRKKRRARAKAVVTALCGVAFVEIAHILTGAREELIPILVGAFLAIAIAILGYRLGLARFYLLAAFALLLGFVSQQLGLRGLPQNIFYFSGIGLSWLVSGAATLVQYLQNTQPPGMKEE